MFNIDYKKTAFNYLLIKFRGPWNIAFLSAIIEPLEMLYNEFLRYRDENLGKLKVTNQKFSIQKHLNDLFDPLERRIEIVKAVLYDGIYLYTEAEDDPARTKTQWLYVDASPIYLFTEAELNSDIDFIVRVPAGINEIRLRAEIEYYMLQSKNYKLETLP